MSKKNPPKTPEHEAKHGDDDLPPIIPFPSPAKTRGDAPRSGLDAIRQRIKDGKLGGPNLTGADDEALRRAMRDIVEEDAGKKPTPRGGGYGGPRAR